MKDNENMELGADLMEYQVASDDYQQRFGRSMTIDLITLINSNDLQGAMQQNEELANFVQTEADKYAPVAQDYLEYLIGELPQPVATEEGGMPTEESGRPNANANEQIM